MIDRRTLLAAVAAAPVAACRHAEPLRIGWQRNGLLLAAKARGAVEAALPDRRIEWTLFPSGPPLLEAMSLGGIDFGGAGDTPPLFAQAAGSPNRYVAAQPVGGQAAAIVVPAGSARRTAADLAGAKLAVTRGTSAQRFVAAALAANGLAANAVETINLTPEQAATAFAANAIDAWAIWDPYLARAEVDHGARVVVAGTGLARSTSFLLASRALVTTSPAVVTTILDALSATAHWAAAHRADLAALIAAATGTSPAVAARIAARQDLDLVPLTDDIVARQQALADRLAADGTLPGPVDVAAAMWHGWRG